MRVRRRPAGVTPVLIKLRDTYLTVAAFGTAYVTITPCAPALEYVKCGASAGPGVDVFNARASPSPRKVVAMERIQDSERAIWTCRSAALDGGYGYYGLFYKGEARRGEAGRRTHACPRDAASEGSSSVAAGR